MDANNATDVIVNTVKKSNLNFFIQESPFSLIINLRKTFIKTKTGLVLTSDLSEGEETAAAIVDEVKVEKLEKENSSLGDSLKHLEAEVQETRSIAQELSIQLEKAKKKTLDALFKLDATKKEAEKLKILVDEKVVENESLRLENKELEVQKNVLKNDKDIAAKNIKHRDKEISRLQNKNDNLEELLKNKKSENKTLEDEKNKLARENKKLEKSLTILQKPASKKKDRSVLCVPTQCNIETQTDVQTCCGSSVQKSVQNFVSITTTTTPHEIPSTNQTCTDVVSRHQCSSSKCEHTPQCVVRQPIPPPSPAITFLYNERSNYHKHMMLWSKKEFTGHTRCFSIENENYGCDDCTWLKWWYKWHGETHGFPDIEEWTYKKYL